MGKRSKVYLPRRHRWFIHPMLLLIWCVTTYAAFWAPERDQESMLGWVIATVVLLGVGIVTWLDDVREASRVHHRGGVDRVSDKASTQNKATVLKYI
jgi:UDP-N-acetylmuramyl pentapeptide phosphotransferase/UDP-N-acetylglucosamine-1-phosphate transferase